MFDKKSVDTDYSALTKEIESSHEAPKLEVGDRVWIAKYNNVLRKCYTKNWPKEIFVIERMIVVERIINELLSRTRRS